MFLFLRSIPSPGTPGEGQGEGDFEYGRQQTFEITLTPALSRRTERGRYCTCDCPAKSYRTIAAGLAKVVQSP